MKASLFHSTNIIHILILFTVKCIYTNGCTVFLVGKNATVDGSVLVSHSNDGEFDTDPRLVKVPAAGHPEGSDRPIFFSPESYPRYVGYDRRVPEYFPRKDESGQYEASFVPIGSIPQVPRTFAYLEDTYGAVNEMQVGIGESTCSGVFGAIPLGVPNGTALFSVDQLTQLAMERSSTAREAIQLMGSLAEEYGFYGAGEFEGTAESLGVSDPNEAWIFHILPDPTGKSAIWAAQKIPDDSMSILANMFIIREVDPDDSDNFVMSDSVHSVAQDYGWWNGKNEDGLLDFTKIYSDGEYAHKFYSGRRMWGGYHLACPSKGFPSDYVDLQSDPVYPVFSQPDRPLSQLDLFRFHRYTYQGTEFDLGADKLAAGPFGSPDRWKEGPGEKEVPGNWERSIGLYRTSDTYVVQSRSSCDSTGPGAVLWFGPASPHGTVFTPFLVHLSDIPSSFRSGHQQNFDRKSAFWAACFVHNIANLKWSYAIKDIKARQAQLEQASIAMVTKMDASYKRDQDMGKVESEYRKNIDSVVSSLWSLSDEIMFKYASGFVNEPNMSQMVGYPAWWLKAVKYSEGPPPPPTKPKCCNLGSGSGDSFLRKHEVVPPLTGKAAMKHYVEVQNQLLVESTVN
jgi:dipeptidase